MKQPARRAEVTRRLAAGWFFAGVRVAAELGSGSETRGARPTELSVHYDGDNNR